MVTQKKKMKNESSGVKLTSLITGFVGGKAAASEQNSDNK